MPDIDLDIIRMIESGNNPQATNPQSGARGLYQIMPKGGALDDWNIYHPKETYIPDDLYDANINAKIASWYLLERIPQMLNYYKKPVTTENILSSYNAGIGYIAKNKELPSETKQYLQKYKGYK